ncbi:MAG: sigma-70 family RNA polymerase sigma factor [Phycisphaerales bacterium]
MPSDRTAFEILIREHGDMLMAYLRSLCDDDDLVEEAFQQTAIDTWKALDQFDRSRPFAPWLRGIGRNRLLVLLRSRGRLRRRLEQFEQLVSARFCELDRLSGDSFPDRVAALRECLAALPAGQRDAIELVYGREQDTHTAATNLGLDWETLRKRVQRARQSLADCLRNKGVMTEATS